MALLFYNSILFLPITYTVIFYFFHLPAMLDVSLFSLFSLLTSFLPFMSILQQCCPCISPFLSIFTFTFHSPFHPPALSSSLPDLPYPLHHPRITLPFVLSSSSSSVHPTIQHLFYCIYHKVPLFSPTILIHVYLHSLVHVV